MAPDERLRTEVEGHPYPLVFATISGAHLYGFPSPDSDYDLRGCHVLPLREVVGLEPGQDTVESTTIKGGLEIDLVTHDAGKFVGLMLKKNGYVLEQLYSPLVVRTTPEHEELKEIGRGCITRHHSHHYFGFAESQWRLFEKEQPRRVKPLLYVYRVLLSGLHLLRTGEVEANLVRLNQDAKRSSIDDLIARKLTGPEEAVLGDDEIEGYRKEVEHFRQELERAAERSHLPDAPTSRAALNDWLVRRRLATFDSGGRGQEP